MLLIFRNNRLHGLNACPGIRGEPPATTAISGNLRMFLMSILSVHTGLKPFGSDPRRNTFSPYLSSGLLQNRGEIAAGRGRLEVSIASATPPAASKPTHMAHPPSRRHGLQ